MKQTKKIILCSIFAIYLVSACFIVKANITKVQRIAGKQQNYNMEEREQITTQIEQNIEKYLNLEDNQVLLQQKIVVNANINDVKKENERLQITVPNIQEKKPEEVVVLANGKVLENQYYNYDAQTNQLNVEIDQNIGTYKIIYNYHETSAEPQTIQLYTKANTKFENVEEVVETQDERTIEISPIGNKVSIEGQITKEVYKGYLYEAKENETTYDENYIVEVSNTKNIEGMDVTKEKEVFTYNIGEEEERTKVENGINNSTYFIQTKINKEQMLDILGEEAVITILNEQEETIKEIAKNTKEDENGDIVIDYTDKEIKNIKILTTKPVKLGEIKIYNKRAIDANTGYTKEEIERFENLESTIKLNESVNTMQMALLDTKSEASININQESLATLQKNENVQIMITLLNNSNQYDLYKNPIVDIILPKELEVEIKNITQINFEDIMKIKSAGIREDSEGRKILRIALEGEQLNYGNNSDAGIQISITADINISNTVPSQEAKIEISCTNENKEGKEFKTESPIKINSKYGVLMISKMENYNQAQEMIETIDSKEVSIKLDTASEERTAVRNNKNN